MSQACSLAEMREADFDFWEVGDGLDEQHTKVDSFS